MRKWKFERKINHKQTYERLAYTKPKNASFTARNVSVWMKHGRSFYN